MDYSKRPDIQRLHSAFASRRDQARREFGHLDRGAFNWSPEPGRWSVAECLEHLNQTGQRWADHLGPILFAAMRHGVHHRTPHVPGRIGRKAIAMMETVSRPLTAPAPFRPADRSDFEPRQVFWAFNAVGESWEATLRRACLLDLSSIRVGSPAAAWMRLPLGTWLFSLSAHEDRHLEQARCVLSDPGFPA